MSLFVELLGRGDATVADDADSVAAMNDAIENRSGHGIVVGEGLDPVGVCSIGCDDGRGLVVAPGEDLEEKLSTELVDREIAEFVNNKDIRFEIALEADI